MVADTYNTLCKREVQFGGNVNFTNSGKLKFPSKSSFSSSWYAKTKTSEGKI